MGFLWAPLMPPPISNQRASRSSTGRARLRQIWSWFRHNTNGHGPAAVRAHTPDQRARRSPNTHAMPCARWHCPLGVHGHTAPLHGPSAQASPNGAVPSSTEIPVVAVMPDDPSPLRLCVGSPVISPTARRRACEWTRPAAVAPCRHAPRAAHSPPPEGLFKSPARGAFAAR